MEKIDFLNGVRVLDCTRLLPGPFATMFLADMGAEVIKIEEPLIGDYMRTLFNTSSKSNPTFQAINRNKKSVAINVKQSEGKKIFLDLVKTADVVVESFRPCIMDKLGIGYDECIKVNPGVIYASVTGWGQTGPYSRMAGHDLNYLGIAGLLGLTRRKQGQEPVLIGTQVADLNGSWQAVIGILGALFRKYQTGKGTFLDVSMLDGMISWETLFLLDQLSKEKAINSKELLLGHMVCYNIYETSDGKYITLGCVETKFWRLFCDAMGRPDWYEHQFEKINSSFYHKIQGLFQERTRDEWAEMGEKADCCLFPLLDIDEIFENPHISARNYKVEYEGGNGQEGFGFRFPIQFSHHSSSEQKYQIAPRLGQHTHEVLTQIGYSDNELDHLQENLILKID